MYIRRPSYFDLLKPKCLGSDIRIQYTLARLAVRYTGVTTPTNTSDLGREQKVHGYWDI
jgi:hypothetical protein